MKVILLILIILLFNCTAKHEQVNQLANQVVGEIPFVIEANKVVIPVRVGDSRVFKIILDSGMSSSGLLLYKQELRDSIGATEFMEANMGGAGSGGRAGAVIADSMAFTSGNTAFKDQRIIVLQTDVYKGFPRDGVIGYAIFGNYAVEINYEKSKIHLYDPATLEIDSTFQSLPIYFKRNNIPWLDAEISIRGEKNIPVSLYIDLASSEALELLIRDSMAFELPDSLEDYYLGRGISGDINGYKGTIAKLRLGSFELTDVVTAFARAEVRSRQPDADGVLSNNTLRRFRVIFDYHHRLLYLKPNKAFNEPFE